MSKTAFKSSIGLANQGKEYPVMTLVREEPELAAVLSKLIPNSRNPAQFNSRGDMRTGEPNIFELRNLADETARNISDAETTMQLLPENELAARILISCVLSPKDMTSTEVNYTAPDSALPPDISGALIKCLQHYFETSYNIKPLLPKILWDIYINTGSYPIAVIPENSIDEVINNNRHMKLEDFAADLNRDGTIRGLDILGPIEQRMPRPERMYSSIAVEEFGEYRQRDPVDPRVRLEREFNGQALETYTSVSDNPNLLKIPQINQKIREGRITKSLGGLALEKEFTGITKLSDRELHGLLYKGNKHQYRPIDTVQTQERLNRRTVGSPLIMHLPSESVIPVFVPGNVTQQVGFFVLIDQNGNPVVRSNEDDMYQQMSNRMSTGGSFATAMLNKVKANTSGLDFDNMNHSHLNYSAQVYGAMVEQDLLSRLRNGAYTNGVELASKPEIYRIMFSRALAAQHTQLLFLPIELVTYFAFKYTQNGIGRSILDEMKILSSLRAMLTFASTMAAMKNSIGRTAVDIKLDENDPDPQKTIERYMHEIARTRQNAFPIGITSPVDLTDYIQRAGFEFGFSGHPRIPDTSVQFTEKNSNYVKPDTDLQDDLRKRNIQKFGIPAQVVDAGFEAEFATSIVTNNILVSKNVMQQQEQLEPMLSDHLRKVAMNDENLIKSLRKILEDNYERLYARLEADVKALGREEAAIQNGNELSKIEQREAIIREVLYEFVMGFNANLPRPNSVSLENQLAAYTKYMEAITTGLDAYLSTAILNADTQGDISKYVDTMKENIKAYLGRKWMIENGMLLELTELVNLDAEGKPLVDMVDIQRRHLEAMTASMNDFFGKLQELKKAANAAEQKREQGDTTEGGAEATTTAAPSTSGSSGGFDSGTGGSEDAFGMGDDGGFGADAGFGSDDADSGNTDETETPADGTTEETPAEPNAEEANKDEEEDNGENGATPTA